MRNKIDYGIDLGTTNSAIARMENGEAVIKKSETLKDTTPSSVFFNRNKSVQVGDQAQNSKKNEDIRTLSTFRNDNSNGFSEFKRTMGSDYKYLSSHMGKEYSSEELSSEVLIKLKSYFQDENIGSIVITVPAKFTNPQKEATIKAGKLAGFSQVELLQEPIAAATAYGFTAKSKDGYWIVFDFGGGTFDAALMRIQEGVISVIDTDGDNWLGGKNLDLAIVDQILIPYLKKTYAIDNVLEDAKKKENLRNSLKFRSEEIKTQLSFNENYSILTELGEYPMEDENGEEIEIELDISRDDLKSVLSPIFQKAIDITKALILRNNLTPYDLDSLILVGGPTHSTILRTMLKEQITEKIDTSIDPMTAVARGAAIFASTLSIQEEVLEKSRDKTKLQLELKYESTSTYLDEMVNIKIQDGTISGEYEAEIERSDKAWSSGRKKISTDASLFDVHLVEGLANVYEIHVYDQLANRVEVQPSQFTIIQGIGGLDTMSTLPYHIGLATYFSTEEKDLFRPIKGLEKNKPIGNSGIVGEMKGLRTQRDIRPGVPSDIIKIPIYQGDYDAEGINPILNHFINDAIFSGATMPTLLKEGSEVNLTFKVNRSEQIEITAEFPSISHKEIVVVDIIQITPPSYDVLKAELLKARMSSTENNADKLIAQITELEKSLENEKASVDGRMQILDNLRKELLELDSIEKTSIWPKVEQELKDVLYELEDLIEKIKKSGLEDRLNMQLVNDRLIEYQEKTRETLGNSDVRRAKELIQDISAIDFAIRSAVTENAMDVDFVQGLNDDFDTIHWSDPNKARLLLNQCSLLISEGKTMELRSLLIQLMRLMPESQRPKDTLRNR